MENEPIRVLHIVPNMQAGGLETLIMNIYRNIDRTKVQFDFLVHYTGNYFYDDEIRSLGGRIYKLSVRDDNNFIKYLKDLDAFFKKHPEYKIVHGHMESLGQFYFKAAKKDGVPVRVAHSHNSATENTFKGKIKGLLLKRLDAWFISNKRTYAVRLFKIMFGIAIGIFILSIVKIKGNTILSLVTGKFTGLFSEDSRSYMQRYGALIIALELILQKNSIFGFLFGNGLSSLVGNFVTNRRTITDLNFYVIDNQYITSWYDSGFVFLILCVFICVHFIIELTKIIVDKHIEISLRKKSLVLLIGMILVMFYSFIIDVLTWYQPIFIISFIIALSNWNIKEAKKECEYTR